MEIGVYVLVAPEPDTQQPHSDDEVYVVLEGRGTLEVEGQAFPVSEGDALFVEAGADHRFTGYESLSVARHLHAAGLTRYSLAEEPVRERVAHELRARREMELLHDVRAVRLGRPHGDVEHLRDLLVRVAEREQAKHLALAVRERIGLCACALVARRPRRGARRARD